MKAFQKKLITILESLGFTDRGAGLWQKHDGPRRWSEVDLYEKTVEVSFYTANYREWNVVFSETTPTQVIKAAIESAARFES